MHAFLLRQGFSRVEYEPLGPSHAPDFLVDGRIAVEVRRLDQNVETVEGPRSLEHVAVPLNRLTTRVCRALGPPVAGLVHRR